MSFFQIALVSFLFLIVTNISNTSLADPEESGLRIVLPPIQVGLTKTYYVQTFFQANWFRALQACKFQGLELASINTQEENDALSDHLVNNGFQGLDYFWISGQNFAQNDSWVWTSTGYNVIYENWNVGEPNNSGGNEHCIEFRPVSANETVSYRWNDKNCDIPQYFFICEKISPSLYNVP